jgi:hypothetical protein
MDGDTELPSPGDLVGGNIAADDEGSVLWYRCQLSCILLAFYKHECATMGNVQASTRRHVETKTGVVVVQRIVGAAVGAAGYAWWESSVRVCRCRRCV